MIGRKTANNVADYIRLTNKNINELQKDDYIKQLANSKVGKTGYCAMFEMKPV